MRHTRFQGAVVQEDSILLVRHLAKQTGNRYWVIPGGGIEPGESEIECVAREIQEETGLDVRVERLLLDCRNPRGRFYRRHKTYLCTRVGGDASPGFEPEEEASNFEITDVGWFPLGRPETWTDRIGERDWVLPLLWEIRRAIGYANDRPTNVEPLDLLCPESRTARAADGTRVRIRPATPEDSASVLTLLDGGPNPGVTEPAIDHEIRARTLWLAETRRRPVGAITAGDEHDDRSDGLRWRCAGTALHVRRMAIASGEPAAGVGALLLAHVERQARILRYGAVRLRVNAADEGTRSVCESRGYRPVGSIGSGVDTLVCYERKSRL